MSEHELQKAPGAPETSSASRASTPAGPSAVQQSLRGAGYAQGAAALSPRAPVQMHGDHDAQPTPPSTGGTGDLDRTRPVGGAIPADIKRRVMDAVRGSPRMQALLQEIADNGGADFGMKWSSRGTYHSAGEIWLDRSWSEGAWVTTMCHELSHLLDFRRGRMPNIRTDTRDAFVRVQMEQEIRAHAINYVAQIELEGAGSAPGAQPLGFAEFKTHLAAEEQRAHQCFTSSHVQRVAETWLAEQYRTNPAFTTSNTNENYYDYWGRAWDEAHAS